jgi:conjugal transfer mating pair stabilization protein TraG
MGMTLKPGASLEGVKPEVLEVLPGLEEIFSRYKASLVVTAGTDGKHMKGSLHYVGRALDLRIKRVQMFRRQALCDELRRFLGKGWDVVLEQSKGNPANDHVHIELDLKKQ